MIGNAISYYRLFSIKGTGPFCRMLIINKENTAHHPAVFFVSLFVLILKSYDSIL